MNDISKGGQEISTRRDFLGLCFITLAATTSKKIRSIHKRIDSESPQMPPIISDKIDGIIGDKKRSELANYLHTGAVTLISHQIRIHVALSINHILGKTIIGGSRLVHDHEGRELQDNEHRKNKKLVRDVETFISPIFEEIYTRGFIEPLLRFILSKRLSAIIGNIIFAYIHNFHGGKLHFDTVPLTQYIGGMQYSVLTDRKGLRHAIFSHTFHNFLCSISKRK